MEEATSGLWGLNQSFWWWLLRCGCGCLFGGRESLNLLPLALVDVDISSISNLTPELGRDLCQGRLCLVCRQSRPYSQITMKDVYANVGNRVLLFEVLLRDHCEDSLHDPFWENKLKGTFLRLILKTVKGF